MSRANRSRCYPGAERASDANTDFVDIEHRRPFDQWWMRLRPAMRAVADEPQEAQ